MFGYAWISLFHKLGGLSFTLTTLLANVLVACWLLLVSVVLVRPAGLKWYSNVTDEEALLNSAEEPVKLEDEADEEALEMTATERLKFICTELWPYTVPLVVVYMSEYAMQSGIAAISESCLSGWQGHGLQSVSQCSRRMHEMISTSMPTSVIKGVCSYHGLLGCCSRHEGPHCGLCRCSNRHYSSFFIQMLSISTGTIGVCSRHASSLGCLVGPYT